MHAAVVGTLGTAPEYAERPEPVPADGTVVAQVRAAALKNIERMLVAGEHYGSGRLPLPHVPGIDAVVQLPDGRRVYAGGPPPGGMMAERAAIDPRAAVEIPDDVDDLAAAAVPNAGVSAWFALEHAGQLTPGQSVLVLGATGVTGGLAVQLAAHLFGAHRVVAAGRNTARLERLAALGAESTIDLGAGDVRERVAALHAERPFDVVLDFLWGPPAEQTLLAIGGDDLAADYHRTRFVQVGEMAGPTISLPAGVLRSAGVELVGQGGGSVPKSAYGRIMTELFPALFGMLADGSLVVDTVSRPLAEVTAAWTDPAPSGTRIVFTP